MSTQHHTNYCINTLLTYHLEHITKLLDKNIDTYRGQSCDVSHSLNKISKLKNKKISHMSLPWIYVTCRMNFVFEFKK
jgi:hypothetical protein